MTYEPHSSGLPPWEAPVMIAEKRKLFFFFQAQQMVADNFGLAMAVSLSYACRNDPLAAQLLPLLAFPLLATGDLCSIYRELKSIHLRNLNKERAEIVAEMWLEAGRIPSAAEV